jgi:hypothetical protein
VKRPENRKEEAEIMTSRHESVSAKEHARSSLPVNTTGLLLTFYNLMLQVPGRPTSFSSTGVDTSDL